MGKNLRDKLYPLLTLLFSLLMILASVCLFYYIKGYRFDFQTKEISTTGILSIDTIPSRSNLYINEKDYGKTPKSVTLVQGDYNIKIDKAGYYPWKKKVSVINGKTTSIYPWLITSSTKKKTIFSSSKTIDTDHIYYTNDSIFFTLYDTTENLKNYEIWKLATASSAWNFSNNPNKVLSFTINPSLGDSFNILPSPNSSLLLFSLTINSIKNFYIINTNEENTINNLTPIILNGFSDYTITWSNSNNALILESSEDIFLYDINTGIKYLITKKEENKLYKLTTDTTGLIYLMIGEQTDTFYIYSLFQYLPNGTLQKEVIPSIYFFSSDEYIKKYRESKEEFSLPFKNSESSSKTSGKIISFSVHEDVDSMFIKTEYAGYWYNLNTSKFILISPYPTDLISISPLHNQLIFKNSQEIGVITFSIQEGETDHYIGKRYVWDKTLINSSDVQWLSTGKNILLTNNHKLYVIDSDGENITEVFSDNPIFSATKNNPSNIYVSVTSKEGKFIISELTIH